MWPSWREHPFLATTTIQFGKGTPAGGIWGFKDNKDVLSDGGGGGAGADANTEKTETDWAIVMARSETGG